MKVLWLARSIPLPLDAGDRIYTAHLAASLAEQQATVTFLGLRPRESHDAGKLSHKVIWRAVDAEPAGQWKFLLSRSPMAEARNVVGPYVETVRSALSGERWDAVVLDHYAMTWCLDIIQKAKFAGRLVHVGHDFETHVTRDLADAYRGNPFKGWLLRENSRRVAAAEQRLTRHCDVIVTLTERDSASFRDCGFDGRSLVLPPGYRGPVCTNRTIRDSTPRQVIAVGSFEWTAKQLNLENFLRAAAQRLADERIGIRIVGRVPDNILLRLKASFPTVQFAGFVPDLMAEFDNTRIALVFDETGGGFKLKMLDYIYSRVPLFGLSNALEGLPASVKDHTVSVTNLPSLVDSIATRIDDIDVLNQMQGRAAEAVGEIFNWERNGERLYEALLKPAERR